MGEIIDLEAVRKKSKAKDDEKSEDLDALYNQLEDLMKKIEADAPLEFFGVGYDQLEGMNDVVMTPAVSALYNAYYSLIQEDREDLAELVADIIKMV